MSGSDPGLRRFTGCWMGTSVSSGTAEAAGEPGTEAVKCGI